MDKGTAGTSSRYSRSGHNYNQSGDDNAASSRDVPYRHGTVSQSPPSTNSRRNESHYASGFGAYSSEHPPRRSVTTIQPFYNLIKQEKFDDLVGKARHFGRRYDGRNHGQYANSIKKYTSASKRPLNQYEQSQLIPLLLQNFQPTRSWSWRSLTTTLHSLISAGVFIPHTLTGESVKRAQADLLSTLLAPITIKCNQKPEAKDIDAQGIANLLWGTAKLVDHGQPLTPEFKGAVAALLPQVNAQRANFKPQEIANLLWAMAKLVDHGQELTPEFKGAVAALLPQVNAQKDRFIPQAIANLLWAMAKLVDHGQGLTPEFKGALAVLFPCVNAQKNQFIPQHIANLLWATAKLVDHGQELTPEFKGAVAALLPQVNAQKDRFIPQHIANLLWAMAKLVDHGQELTPEFKGALAALLPQVNAQKDQFIPQHIANLLWAAAKLVDHGQEWTPVLKGAVAALLPQVNAQKANFQPQGIANLLWALAKLVDHRQDLTSEFKGVLAALLPQVNAQRANFKLQEIANLLWAMAKLVDHGQELTPEFKGALAALLPQVNAQKDQFIPQHIANLLWAAAKLVDHGQEWTPVLKGAVAALLPQVNAQKANFQPQGIANLLWALAKLVDHAQDLTSEFRGVVAALLLQVKAQKDQFIPKQIANLLWAMAKLGELVELNLVKSTLDSLVYVTSENPRFSQQDTLLSLWGVMACSARLFLDSNAKKNGLPEKLIRDLFAHLENNPPEHTEGQRIIAMAASWLGRVCPVAPHYQRIISNPQSTFRNQLQSRIPSLMIEEEKSLNALSPVDLLLPDHNIVIEVQGPFHYVGGDFQTRNGSTLLKIALLQKLGFEVIEISANKLANKDSMERVIDQIQAKLNIPLEGRGSVSLKRRGADEACIAADEGQQYLDDRQSTAETGEPLKKKKK